MSDIEQSRKDANLSVSYFKLRKLKQMLEQNQQELEHEKDPLVQQQLIELHIELKKFEREITSVLGTVILK